MCALYGVCYNVVVPDAGVTVFGSLLSRLRQRWDGLLALIFWITATLWGFLS